MAVGMLDGFHIAHDGLGEVGQITSPEKRQREFPQTLGQPDALSAALVVDNAVLVVVGKVLGDEQRHCEYDKPHQIRQKIRQRRAAYRMVDKRPIARNKIPTPANTATFDTAVHAAPSLTLRAPA